MHEKILKILLAMLVGALVGAGREFHVSQGLRTVTLLAVGANVREFHTS